MFNTGTAAWLYRSLVESLFGLRGDGDGLRIAPQLPAHWPSAHAVRRFRGATFKVGIERVATRDAACVLLDGEVLADGRVARVEAGRRYQMRVELPAPAAPG